MAREVLQAGERRLARVEALRALAAIGVMLGHAWGTAHSYGPDAYATYLGRIVFGGGFGVFLFFALSGYLLYWPFAKRDFGEGARIDLGTYVRNRALRILPLYYVAIVVLLVVQEHGGTREQWWRFLTLFENFSNATVGTVDGALWSVVVEIHFYALLPLLALLVARLARRSIGRAAAVLLLIGAFALAARLALVTFADAPAGIWRYNLPTTFFFFVPGMMLALMRVRLERGDRPGWLDGTLGNSLTWVVLSAVVWLVLVIDYRLTPIAAVAAFLAVGACVLPLRESLPLRVLNWPPLVAVGVVSYSLYVWHSRVIASLEDTLWLAVPLAIAVAFVSYRLIEAPALRLRRRWSSASAPIERTAGSEAAHAPAHA